MKTINAAIAYDFDGTLVPGYMQDHSFFPSLGVDNPFEDFWPRVREIAKAQDMDEILAYMQLMLKEADYHGISIRKEKFIEHGRGIKFFPGVETWFDRINAMAAQRGIALKHYIISSGLREMIQGTSIAPHFAQIFASGFMYNQDDVAIWPALAVNYTNKTQYLWRINKGIENSWDNTSLNTYMDADARPIPQENIIYIGDGETDIPAMKMTKYMGGHAIATYDEARNGARQICDQLLSQQRADYSVAANYQPQAQMEQTICTILDRIHARQT